MSKLKTYKFSQLYSMSSGISSKPEQAGHGKPFLSFSTVFNNYFLPDSLNDLMDTSEIEQETYSILKGDIFLTRTSEVIDELGMSSVALKDYPKAAYSGFLKRLRPTQTDVTYHKYMAFYLRSKLFRKTMTNNAVLTLRASLNENIFSYLDLILPEYNQQVKIGDLLYLINSKIELNNRINAELESLAKTIYDYWFVQFDFPFDFAQGKPSADGKPYKSSGGEMVYVKGGGDRAIPAGWEVISINEIATLSNDSINPMIFPNKIFKYYSIPVFDELKTYSLEEGENIRSNKFTVTGNDVVISKLNPWFNRVIYPLSEDDMICSTEFVIWRTSNKLIKNFLYSIATSQPFISFCTQLASGTSNSHKRISPNNMMKYKIIFNEELANLFGEKVNPIIKLRMQNQKQNQQLTQLRDWLLPMLMNGQVSIK